MRQLESTAAQLLLAVWRPPYTGLIVRRHLQVNLRDVYRNFYRIVFPGRSSAMRQLESALTGVLSLYGRPPYSRITASYHLQASLRDTYR